MTKKDFELIARGISALPWLGFYARREAVYRPDTLLKKSSTRIPALIASNS